MQNYGVAADAFVYPILIKLAGKSSVVLNVHLLKLGHGCDHYFHNAIMVGYAKYGPIQDAPNWNAREDGGGLELDDFWVLEFLKWSRSSMVVWCHAGEEGLSVPQKIKWYLLNSGRSEKEDKDG